MRVIATAGHVDHGKSTLIRLLSGTDPDRWEQEHRRGMTIDLGFAWTTTDDGATLAFVDVPGHERFVGNMLAGIGPVPAVMLVIAADEGWMPQTAEHVQALDALGVHHGVLVITRSDLADPATALHETRRQLAGTSLADLPAVTVSGTTGTGVDSLRRALHVLAAQLPTPSPDADPRLWVDRAFTIRGAGTVVTGTLPAGTLSTGDRLLLHRANRSVTVRGMQCLGTDTAQASGIARVAVNLRGVHFDEVHRGEALVQPGRWLAADLIDVRVRGCDSRELPRHPTLHTGSAAVAARVRPLGADTARLSLYSPLPLRIGDRALLRDPGSHRVPAGVVVVDVRPPELHRRGAAKRRAAELAGIAEKADGVAELHRRGVVRTGELRAMGASPPPGAPTGGEWLLDPCYRDELASRLARLVTEHARAHPLEGGMATEEARRCLELPDSALLTPVLHGRAAAEISEHGGRLRLGTTPLPEPVHDAVRAVQEQLTHDPFRAPTATELAELGLGAKQLAAAARAGELLKVSPEIYLLPDAPQRALRWLSQLPAPFTLSQARQTLGTSRRVAVPLLELLARRRDTETLADGTHRLR